MNVPRKKLNGMHLKQSAPLNECTKTQRICLSLISFFVPLLHMVRCYGVKCMQHNLIRDESANISLLIESTFG